MCHLREGKMLGGGQAHVKGWRRDCLEGWQRDKRCKELRERLWRTIISHLLNGHNT